MVDTIVQDIAYLKTYSTSKGGLGAKLHVEYSQKTSSMNISLVTLLSGLDAKHQYCPLSECMTGSKVRVALSIERLFVSSAYSGDQSYIHIIDSTLPAVSQVKVKV